MSSRIYPLQMCMLKDSKACVRAEAVFSLINILRQVESIPMEHERLFLDYILSN